MYRTLLCAGAAVGLFAATAAAQAPQRDRQLQERNGQARELLKDLEGNWDIEVQVWSMADAQRETRPGMQPGQPRQPGQQEDQQQIQRIQQQIQQAMSQAGVSQEDAREHAERLARQFVQQRPQLQQIQQRLQQAMTQVGVDQQEAQQQARRLAQQIQQQLEQARPGRPGIGGDDDFQSQLTRPGDRDEQEYGEATLRAEGSSSRSWILEENILEEEVDFSMTTEAPEDRPDGQQLGGQREQLIKKLRDGDTLEGHGMFGVDEETGHIYHVWADSSEGKIFFSVGEFDARQRTVTFHTADAREILNGSRREMRPGTQPGRPGQQPGQQPDWNNDQPRQPGADLQVPRDQQQPGQREHARDFRGMGDREDRPRVVLRIVDDNEHVVEYYRGTNPTGQVVRTMVVTYTRNNSN